MQPQKRMILGRIAAPIFVASAVFTLYLTADAAVPVPPITTWIDAKRTFVGETTSLWIRVANDSEALIGRCNFQSHRQAVYGHPIYGS